MIQCLIISLFLTLLIECSIAFLLGIRTKEDIKVVMLANICTNPVVVYISNLIMLIENDIIYLSIVLFLEIAAWIAEFYIYKKFLKFKRISPLIISLICNSLSFGIGIIISAL